MITIIFLGGFFLLLLIIILKSRTGFKKIDEMYGKPDKAKLVKMIGGHPELKPGTMAMSLHPKDAMVFNRKAFQFSQISAIKIITELPKEYKNGLNIVGNFGADEQYLCISVTDEYGDHEIIFTVKPGFEEIANQVIQRWNKYYLLSYKDSNP